MGLFMSSISGDAGLAAGTTVAQSARQVLRDMGARSLGSARSFGRIAAIFSFYECALEGFRARRDRANALAAGCLTGGTLAVAAGPQAVALGCVGFAAFSAAVDHFMSSSRDADDV